MANANNDQAILDTIFNPLLPHSGGEDKTQNCEDENELNQENTESARRTKEMETLGVQRAESGDLDGALECFNQAVELAPNRASSYNNRAQLWRLKGDIQHALEDLNEAIELGGARGTATAQAYTQRGLIRRLNGDDDEAVEDFKKAAALGSDFAKNMVVQMNPYAAMCNKMLAEAVNKLKEGPQSRCYVVNKK